MTKKAKEIPFSILKKDVERRAGKRKMVKIPVSGGGHIPIPEDVVISLQHIEAKETPRCFHRFFVLKFHFDKFSAGYVESDFYNFRPETGMLVFPYQMHCLTDTGGGGQMRLLINFSLPKQDEEMLRSLRGRPFRMTDADCRLLREILQLTDDDTSSLRLRCLIGELLLTILAESASAVSVGYSETVRPIFDFLCEHCGEPISVKSIAETFRYSESGIRAMFRRETGRTPGAFLKELRLNKAAKLLRSTGMEIDRIAAECGFSNRYVFSRAFKKQFDLPPVRFRRQWFEYI